MWKQQPNKTAVPTEEGSRYGCRRTLVQLVCGVKAPRPRADPTTGCAARVWAKEASAMCWKDHCRSWRSPWTWQKKVTRALRDNGLPATSCASCLARLEWYKQIIWKKKCPTQGRPCSGWGRWPTSSCSGRRLNSRPVTLCCLSALISSLSLWIKAKSATKIN